MQLAGGEPVAGGEQHPSVDPGRGGGGAATAELLTGDPLTDLGDHLVRQSYEVEVVDGDLRARSAALIPGA